MNATQTSTSDASITMTETIVVAEAPTLRLRCHQPKTDKKVQFSQETVDNEHMDKKKSKCCCVYVKPKKFGESSSESENEDCEHCSGHVEKKKHKALKHKDARDISHEPSVS